MTHLTLPDEHVHHLTALLAKGQLRARSFKRATALLELHRGKNLAEVALTLGVVYTTVAAWRDRYNEQGLGVLYDKPRSGRPVQIDGAARAKVTALACSTPPEGYAQWSLRLLADRAVELGYVDHLSHTHVGTILKKTTCSPTASALGV
jgi:transposase